jgi:hypothetical protein
MYCVEKNAHLFVTTSGLLQISLGLTGLKYLKLKSVVLQIRDVF